MKSQRKLTAIMFTDIVGYSNLSEKNEQLALSVLLENSQLHKILVAKYRGQHLKEIGDGTLAIFDSAIDAALCAIDIQRHINQNCNYKLRIGLHIGDVLASSNDIVGNSVNIAARIQGATQANTIAISEAFYESINSQADFVVTKIGDVILKGISHSVVLYRLDFANHSLHHNSQEEIAVKRSMFFAAVPVLLATIIVCLTLYLYFSRSDLVIVDANISQATSQHDNPISIAVLPFIDFTSSQDQRYFGEGLSEELLNLFAKMQGVKVASRTSSFAFKNSNQDIKAIGEQLNVNYILEGSVRRSQDQIRITAQLINTKDGFHLWSETYDSNLDDIFAIQDEIASSVTQSFRKLIDIDDALLPRANHPQNFAAYDAYLKGLSFLYKEQNTFNIDSAEDFFLQAIDIDPSYTLAYAGLCRNQVNRYILGNNNKGIVTANAFCMKALELDPEQKEVHVALGHFYHSTGDYKSAQASFDTALSYASGDTNALMGKAASYADSDASEKAEDIYKKIHREQPQLWKPINELGALYLTMGKIKDAIPLFEKVIHLMPKSSVGYTNLGYAYYYLNDTDWAIEYWQKSLQYSEDADVYSNLGTLFYQKSEFNQAVEMYKKAINLLPDLAIYWGNLADALYFSNNNYMAETTYTKAISLAEKALVTNNNDVAALSTLALYNARIGKSVQAKQYIKQALSLAPQEINVLYYAAIAYFQMNDEDVAWEMLEQAISSGYPPELLATAPELKEYHSNSRFEQLFQSTKETTSLQ